MVLRVDHKLMEFLLRKEHEWNILVSAYLIFCSTSVNSSLYKLKLIIIALNLFLYFQKIVFWSQKSNSYKRLQNA